MIRMINKMQLGKIKSLLLLAAVIFVSVSCKKNETSVSNPKTYLAGSTDSQIGQFIVSYDSQNRLLSTAFVSKNESVNRSYIYTVTAYNGQGAITAAKLVFPSNPANNNLQEMAYDGNNQHISTTTRNAGSGSLTSTSTADYSIAGQVRTTRRNASGAITSSSLHKLSADGKNVTEVQDFDASGTLLATTTYSGFNNYILGNTLYPKGFSIMPLSTNGFSTYTYTLPGGSPIINSYTYEANTDGYITKRTNTTTSGEVSYEYFKK